MAVDADLIRTCADPGLKPAIVEKFVQAAGSPDPLAITVLSGSRIVLVPPPKTPDDALELIRRHVGQVVVRVGVTQYPAGIGIKELSEVSPDLLDACKNLRMGTALFGKVWRIVMKWYGNPTDQGVLAQVLDDAVDAWKRGQFEGTAVFTAPDPGEPKAVSSPPAERPALDLVPADQPAPSNGTGDPNKASIRVDLSGIGGRSP